MPKLKTKRSAAKRYKVTGSGKIRISRKGKSHILTKKTTKRKRKLRKSRILKACDERMARSLLPYA